MKRPEWLKIKDATTALAVVVAGAYLAGYWGWGYYAKSEGLGFLHLSTPQFLAAGMSLLILDACAVGLLYFAFELVAESTKKWPATFVNRLWRVLLEFLALGVGGVVLEIVIGSVGNMFGLLDFSGFMETHTLVLAFLFPSGIYLFLLISFTAPRLGDAARWLWTHWNKNKLERKAAPPLGKRSQEFHSAARVSGLIFMAPLMALFFLPALSPSFGGAEPRHAYLDLERGSVSPDTLARLVPQSMLNSTSGVLRTDELVVLFDNGDTLMVRRADHPKANDPLYDLSQSVVRARIWLRPTR